MPDARDIRNEEAVSRYVLEVDGRIAFLEYHRYADSIDLFHTWVPEDLRGRGLGGMLVKRALDDARAAGLRVIPTCPMVDAYIRRHPEYQPLVG